MAQTVQLPNGQELEFPDDMSQGDMAAAIQKSFPEYAPKKGVLAKAEEAASDAYHGILNSALPANSVMDKYDSSNGAQSSDIQTDAAGNISTPADRAMDISTLKAAAKNSDQQPSSQNQQDDDMAKTAKFIQGNTSPRIADQQAAKITPEQALANAEEGTGNDALPLENPANETLAENLKKDAQFIAVPIVGGAATGLLSAGAAYEDAFGNHEGAANLDQIRKNWEGLMAENGGDTLLGKAESIAGGIAPAFLLPEAKLIQMVGNAGLFAIPGFRDTLNEKLAEGESYAAALAHAGETFGINLFMPTVATHGSAAVANAVGAAGAQGAKGAALALGQAAGEGAAFSGANSVLDKGTDLAFNQQNNNDWINPEDMAANALAFGGLRVAHLATKPVDQIGADIQNSSTVDEAIAKANEIASAPAPRQFGILSQGGDGFKNMSELADLVQSEKSDLDQQRAALQQQQQADRNLRFNSELESTDNRVAGAQAAQTRADRLGMLDSIYSNPDERTPGMTFLDALEKQYPNNPLPTPEEKALMAKRESAYQAFNQLPEEQPESLGVPEKQQTQNQQRSQDEMQAQVDQFLANGYRPMAGGKVLMNNKGKKLILNAAQRDYLTSLPQAIGTAATSPVEQPAASNTQEAENAIQESGTGGVLQLQQEGTGGQGGERGRVEPSQQGAEVAAPDESQRATQSEAPQAIVGAQDGSTTAPTDQPPSGNVAGAGSDITAGGNAVRVSGLDDGSATGGSGNTGEPLSGSTENGLANGTAPDNALIRQHLNTLISRNRVAKELGLSSDLYMATAKAKKVLETGSGNAADFRKVAKKFDGKDEPIKTALNGIADAIQPVKKPQAAKRQQRPSGDLLQRIKQLGGIDNGEMLDITGENDRKNIGGWRFAFNKKGRGLDDLATMLADDGFAINTNTVDGGVQQLRDMIRDHMNGERNFKTETQQTNSEQVTDERRYDDMVQHAESLGINVKGMSEQDIADAIYQEEDARAMAALDEAEAEASDAIFNGITDDGNIDFDNLALSTPEQLAAWLGEEHGQTAIESDNLGSASGKPEESVAGNGATAQGAPAARQEIRPEERPDFALASQSEAELKAQDLARQKAADEQARKAAAPPPEEFKLTGSDRAADIGAAHGQQDIFSQPAEKQKEFTYAIKPHDGGFIIESDDGGGVVLAGKPNAPGILNSTPARVFKTEKEARLYLQDKGMKEAAQAASEQHPNATAPEHVQTGVDDRELGQIVKEFKDAQQSMMEEDQPVTNIFQPPKKSDIVRLGDKVKVYTKEHGWMTPEEAKARIAEWKQRSEEQGDNEDVRNENSRRVVLSLFDLSGEWSKPWEEAGYQVYRFDIQNDPDVGDVNNFSTDFFGDWFGDFEGMDIYAILAATPCTDFAVSGARHFAAKDADGRTVASVKLVHQTLRTIEYFKPAIWAIENPVGRIEDLGGLPPWRLSFDPNHLGDPYTKKTLLWGRFNADLPIAPVEPTEGSKMHKLYGGKSQATKNARSVTPEGFSYGFFMANNAHDHLAMAVANKYDRLDSGLIEKAIKDGVTEQQINNAVEDHYYMDMDDEAANDAIRELIGQKEEENKGAAIDSLKQSDMPKADQVKLAAQLRTGEVKPEDVHAVLNEPSGSVLDAHEALFKRIQSGESDSSEFKQAFTKLLGDKDAAIAELSKMTKPQIFERFPSLEWRYKNDKKADVVDAAYRDMLSDYVLGDSFSHGMGKNAFENGIQAVVDRTTDDKLKDYADKVNKARAEREAQRKEIAAGMENPKTLNDYRRILQAKIEQDGMSFRDARLSLSSEQRAEYDQLAATATRSERISKKNEQRTTVRAAGVTTGADIIETKHTRDGYDLFVVKPAERVERDAYNAWNAAAKKLGGWYSSFKGNGAVPGFQFKSRESAEAFQKFVNGGDTEAVKEQAQARRDAYADDRSQTAVERLNEMASALDEKADSSLNQDRKANTERRARFAASAEAKANADKAMAQTMRNIAAAIENGTAKMLDQVRQKSQVEMLQGFVRTAHQDMLRDRYKNYSEYEKHQHDKPTAEVADYAEFPSFTMYRSDLASLARRLTETEGTKLLGQRILKVADDVSNAYLKFAKENIDKVGLFRTQNGERAVFSSKKLAEHSIEHSGFNGTAIALPFKRGENVIVLSPSEARKRGIWSGDDDKRITLNHEVGSEIVEKLNRKSGEGAPWQFETANDRLKRLAAMGIETGAEFRSALREFINLREAPKEADKIKQMERAMIGRRNDGLDFFPTPENQADEMVGAADIKDGMSVLEPEAGMGHIADRIREAGHEPDVAELSGDRRELLEAKGYNVVGHDFMGMTLADTPDGKGYDRIIMNPPFSDRRDIAHVRHAYDLLKPGGRLTAIMGEGAFFGSDAKARDFRDWLEKVGGSDEKLPDGTFLDSSLPVNTGAAARMVVIDKPEGAQYSRGSTTIAKPIQSPNDLRNAFESKFPELSTALDELLAGGERGVRGGIVFVPKVDDLLSTYAEKTGRTLDEAKKSLGVSKDMRYLQNGDIQALYDPKSGMSFIVGENNDENSVPGAILHEMIHSDQMDHVDNAAKDLITSRRELLPQGTRDFLGKVESRLVKSQAAHFDDAGKLVVDEKTEVAPYIVEEAAKSARQQGFSAIDGKFMDFVDRTFGKRVGNVIRNFVATVRAALLRRGVAMKPSIDDLMEFAKASMKNAANENIKSYESPEFMAHASKERDWYYSALSKAVDGAPDKIFDQPASSIKLWLQANAPKLNVKKDELQWSGVLDWLDMQGKNKVSRQDVANYLRDGGVQLQETKLGGSSEDLPMTYEELPPDMQRLVNEFDNSNMPVAEFQQKADAQGYAVDIDFNGEVESIVRTGSGAEPTKFHKHKLPGGEDYREFLLTLPVKHSSEFDPSKLEIKRNRQSMTQGTAELIYDGKSLGKFNDEGNSASTNWRRPDSHWQDVASKIFYEGNVLPDGRVVTRPVSNGIKFRSSHWNQPNVIAHMRVDTVSGADGKKYLRLMEVQSDWAQKGRKEGFSNKPATHPSGWASTNDSKSTGAGIPEAPFVTDTKAWTSLLIKRAIALAAEEGHDGIVFANGQENADLYDLSQHVDEIQWEPPKDGGTGKLFAFKDGDPVIHQHVPEKEIADFLGKDVARKLLEQPVNEDGRQTLSGSGLKIGGEGMRAFYDQIIPQVANDVLKKTGAGVKVDEVDLGHGLPFSVEDENGNVIESFRTRDEAVQFMRDSGWPVLSHNASEKHVAAEAEHKKRLGFSITPEYRNKVLQDGLPLFSQSRFDQAGFLHDSLSTLAAENNLLFKHQVSDSKDLATVVKEVTGSKYLGDETRPDERDQSGADARYAFRTASGHLYYVMERGNEVWIDVSRLKEGSGGGQLIYAAVANYAHNTGKKFVGDPYGLSAAAVIRRTINMLSSAIRFGTTRHLEAAQQQEWGSPDDGVEPLDWHGSDIDKLNAMVETVIGTADNLAPNLSKFHFDFSDGKFKDQQGNVVTRKQILMAVDARPDTGRAGEGGGAYSREDGLEGRTFPQEAASDEYSADSQRRAARIGETTASQIVFLKSLISEGSKGVGQRAGILEKLLQWNSSPEGQRLPSSLRALFSRRDADGKQSKLELEGGENGKPNSWEAPAPSRMDNFIYQLQDKHIDLKRVSDAIRATGKQIAEAANPYLKEELYHGRAATRTEQFLEKELQPLIDEMRARRVSLPDFEEYLWMRHAEERNAQIARVNPDMPDGGSGIKTAEARDYMENLPEDKRKAYESLAKRVDAINKETRQTWIKYGLESPDAVRAMEDTYQHYVPLMREDMDRAHGMGTGQGFSIKGNATKRATGSNRAVVDVLANIAMARERAITRGEKNRVAKALIGMAAMHPNPDFWRVEEPPTVRGINPSTGLVEDRVDPLYKSRDNVVMARAIVKGKPVEYSLTFNEHDERAMRMAQAIKNLDQDQMADWMGKIGSMTRYFASINTQYNPMFGIVNLMRDTATGALNLTTTPLVGKEHVILKNTIPALKGIYTDIRAHRRGQPPKSEWSKLFDEFKETGGQTGYRDLYRNAKDRTTAIEHALDPDWWMKTKFGKLMTAGGTLEMPQRLITDKAVRPMFDWLSDYNEAMENAVRLAAYKEARDTGLSQEESASIAKNLTVNFNRKGKISRELGALYAFFNASVQGTARMAETLVGKRGKQIVAGGIMLGVIQAVTLAAAGFKNNEPPDFVKDRNVIIPIGNGKYVSIPMPLGFNVLPVIGRCIAEAMLYGHPMDRAVHIAAEALDMYNPIGTATFLQTVSPTVLDPAVALAENKDWTGKPIAKLDDSVLKQTPGFTRAKDTSTPVSRVLSEAINYLTGGDKYTPGIVSPTPDQLDYLGSQIGGGVWREASKVWQAGESGFTGEELPNYKMPLIGKFYGNTKEQSSQADRFYNNLQSLNELEAEVKGRHKDHLPVSDYIKDHPEVRLAEMANKINLNIQKMHKLRRELVERGASKDRIKLIDSRITAQMQRLNDRVDQLQQQVR